jgi:hypothetical protein
MCGSIPIVFDIYVLVPKNRLSRGCVRQVEGFIIHIKESVENRPTSYETDWALAHM